jgi:hypothetical protein
MDSVPSVLAVVDVNPAGAVVWWVNVGSVGRQVGRLCGAWVIDEAESARVRQLLSGRLVLPTAAARELVRSSHVDLSALVDSAGTLANVADTRDALQAAFESEIAALPKGRALVAPSWPALPQPLDPESPPLVVGTEPVRRALGIARWFDTLCQAWDGIEEQRLARKYLRSLGGDSARPLPAYLEERAGARA